jgi:hypothetical protein
MKALAESGFGRMKDRVKHLGRGVFMVLEDKGVVQAGERQRKRRRNLGTEVMRRTASHRAMGLGSDLPVVVGVELDTGSEEEEKDQ